MPTHLIFFVADLDSRGELRSKSQYTYEALQQIPGAEELITHFSANLWRSPEEFETPVPGGHGALVLRWRASAPTAGVATLRFHENLSSLSLLATGINPDADRLTFQAFQQ